MDLLLQLLANGLVIGAFYALSALGLTLVFGLMRVVNFAHGELYVVGGLLGWAFTDLVGFNFCAGSNAAKTPISNSHARAEDQ